MTTAWPSSSVIYVSSADSSDIHMFRLEPDGGLRLIERSPLPGLVKAGGSIPLAVSPDRRILYAASRGEPLFAASFSIDAAGRLSHIANGPLVDSMAYIATDRTGRFLFGASYGGHKISVNPIAPEGIVLPASQVLATEPNAHAILPVPDNRFVLATSLGGDVLLQHSFDAATGKLAPDAALHARTKEKAGPRHLIFHPNGRRVYVVNELDASVSLFDYEPASGRLALRQTVSALPPGFEGKPWAADIRATPDGRFLYASERTSSTLSMFAIEAAGGALSLIGFLPTEQQPRSFAIDPTGRYLFSVGESSHSMSSYSIDPQSGMLTKLEEYPVGGRPNWIESVALP